MLRRTNSRGSLGTTKYVGVRVLSLLFLCPLVVWGQGDQDPGTDAPVEFILRPVREGFRARPYDARRESEMVFRKEPDYAGHLVYRRALPIGVEPSDFMGVAYDGGAQLLYIDRNRNLDLTDDGPGIAADDGSSPGYSRFENVGIVLERDGIPVPYTLDISFYLHYFSVTVKSGWEGDVEIGGIPCQMGIADNLDGIFSARDVFWLEHERNRQARFAEGSRDDLELPDWFYFEGAVYRLERELRELDGEVLLAVAFTPVVEELMEIAFEGRFVSRVMLSEEGGGYGMLEWPSAAMRIPQGIYNPMRVDLLDSYYGYARHLQMLKPGGNTLLKAGGPMRHEVSVERSGTFLSLKYVLRGMDNLEYAPDRRLRYGESAPRFAIYQGGLRVGAGQFEYG